MPTNAHSRAQLSAAERAEAKAKDATSSTPAKQSTQKRAGSRPRVAPPPPIDRGLNDDPDHLDMHIPKPLKTSFVWLQCLLLAFAFYVAKMMMTFDTVQSTLLTKALTFVSAMSLFAAFYAYKGALARGEILYVASESEQARHQADRLVSFYPPTPRPVVAPDFYFTHLYPKCSRSS